jgi:hypothetical protein
MNIHVIKVEYWYWLKLSYSSISLIDVLFDSDYRTDGGKFDVTSMKNVKCPWVWPSPRPFLTSTGHNIDRPHKLCPEANGAEPCSRRKSRARVLIPPSYLSLGKGQGVRHSWNLVQSTQKSNQKSRNHEGNQWILKSEITQNFIIIEPTVYMTAVTHRNQEIGLEIRLETKKSHYKSTEICLEINKNQVRNHVISKYCTLHVAVSDPSGKEHISKV